MSAVEFDQLIVNAVSRLSYYAYFGYKLWKFGSKLLYKLIILLNNLHWDLFLLITVCLLYTSDAADE